MLSHACEAFYLVDKDTYEGIDLFIQHRLNRAKDLAHRLSTFGKVLAEQGMCIDLNELALGESLPETYGNLLSQGAAQSRLATPR